VISANDAAIAPVACDVPRDCCLRLEDREAHAEPSRRQARLQAIAQDGCAAEVDSLARDLDLCALRRQQRR
jgi:hypothetical protein